MRLRYHAVLFRAYPYQVSEALEAQALLMGALATCNSSLALRLRDTSSLS